MSKSHDEIITTAETITDLLNDLDDGQFANVVARLIGARTVQPDFTHDSQQIRNLFIMIAEEHAALDLTS